MLADVSGNDPEVLYSLGVAHTFGKRVFLVTDNLDRLPYDLASSRAWVVDPASDNRDILRAMAQFLRMPYAIGPVRVFLGQVRVLRREPDRVAIPGLPDRCRWMLLLLGLVLHLVLPGDQPTILGRVAFSFSS